MSLKAVSNSPPGTVVTSVSGTANRITVTGTTAVTIDIAATYVGQSSITTVGTLTGGATGAGFTVALSTSTITGTLLAANGGTGATSLGSTFSVVSNVLRSTESFVIAASDESTVITSGTDKVIFRIPYNFTLTAVRASLSTASSSGLVTVDINESGVSILSTKLTIDANETTSVTAATPPVISDSSLANDAQISIDIDGAGTGAKGLKVTLIGYQA